MASAAWILDAEQVIEKMVRAAGIELATSPVRKLRSGSTICYCLLAPRT